jgi:hypothetical protein
MYLKLNIWFMLLMRHLMMTKDDSAVSKVIGYELNDWT